MGASGRGMDNLLKSAKYIFVIMALLSTGSVCQAVGLQPWVLIDTHDNTLSVMSPENRTIVRFHNIAIGSGGTAKEHLRGDDTTPLGIFHVAWINRKSRFGTFFGLDYPSQGLTVRAYIDGAITEDEFDQFVDAFRHHRLPPQNTHLGGRIGIHGVGRGNPRIQQSIDWTDGCVAVTNRDINRLAQWIHIGTKVVIR